MQRRALGFVVLSFGLALGCSADKNEAQGEEDGSPSTSGSATAEDDSATTSPGDSDPDGGSSGSNGSISTSGPGSTSDASADSAGFVMTPDNGTGECDPKEQDCPKGEKCTAWANDGGTFWNSTKCVEETGAGVGGDMCMVEGGGVSGLDDCAKGFICMNTDQDGIGQCIEFCQGQNEDCAPGEVCAIYNDGVLPICLVGCDPLLQDCPVGQACIDTPNQSFICFNDASGEAGMDGDPCPPEHGENSCDPGLWCGPNSSGCVDVNCCTPYCDLSDPQCTSPDECVSFFDEGNAPPGFEDVGVCVLP